MKKEKQGSQKQVLMLSDVPSPYFEEVIFVLKEQTVQESDRLLNEARGIVDTYIKRFEAAKTPAGHDYKLLAISVGCSAVLCGVLCILSLLHIL